MRSLCSNLTSKTIIFNEQMDKSQLEQLKALKFHQFIKMKLEVTEQSRISEFKNSLLGQTQLVALKIRIIENPIMKEVDLTDLFDNFSHFINLRSLSFHFKEKLCAPQFHIIISEFCLSVLKLNKLDYLNINFGLTNYLNWENIKLLSQAFVHLQNLKTLHIRLNIKETTEDIQQKLTLYSAISKLQNLENLQYIIIPNYQQHCDLILFQGYQIQFNNLQHLRELKIMDRTFNRFTTLDLDTFSKCLEGFINLNTFHIEINYYESDKRIQIFFNTLFSLQNLVDCFIQIKISNHKEQIKLGEHVIQDSKLKKLSLLINMNSCDDSVEEIIFEKGLYNLDKLQNLNLQFDVKIKKQSQITLGTWLNQCKSLDSLRIRLAKPINPQVIGLWLKNQTLLKKLILELSYKNKKEKKDQIVFNLIKELKHLETLKMQGFYQITNRLNQELAKSICSLSNLQSLDVEIFHNEEIIMVVSCLPHLQHLRNLRVIVNHNNLFVNIQEFFINLKYLTNLQAIEIVFESKEMYEDIMYDELVILLQGISNLYNIKFIFIHLNLQYNIQESFYKEASYYLKSLPNLSYLYLYQNYWLNSISNKSINLLLKNIKKLVEIELYEKL